MYEVSTYKDDRIMPFNGDYYLGQALQCSLGTYMLT